jgi:hypothetical protein
VVLQLLFSIDGSKAAIIFYGTNIDLIEGGTNIIGTSTNRANVSGTNVGGPIVAASS